MFPRVLFPTILLMLIGTGVLAEEKPGAIVPAGYKQIWSDEFTSLSLRTGGPTYDGLESGSGTWSAPGASYSNDPRGVAGYGHDWFTNPSFYGWPAGYPAHGQFAITSEGLRIRAEAPSPAMAAILPTIKPRVRPSTVGGQGVAPWLAGQINSFHAVRIKPPFYFEARAKMPAGSGRPFPAIWLKTEARRVNDHGMNYEIDIQEGFGDSDRLHAGVHWDVSPVGHDYHMQRAVDIPAGLDLSASFNIWGCAVTKERQIFFFNGVEVGRVETPANANVDQPYGIMLDVSAGLPWNGGGPPSEGPHDMIVRYVRLYAPDTDGLTLR
jgi:hypothetical protein